MARLRRNDESHPPEYSIVVTDTDGTLGRGSVPHNSSRALLSSTRWRFGVLLTVVAVFAFGVVAGRSTIHVQTGRGTIAATAESASTESAHPTTSPARQSTHNVTGTPAPQGVVGANQQPVAGGRLVEVPGECDQMKYVATVGYVTPLPAPIDMTVFAGSPPRLYDLNDGIVGPPLFRPSDHESVIAIAADGHGVVVVTRACTDPMWVKVERIGGDGAITRIEIPTGWRPSGNLTVIDGQAWVALSREHSGSFVRLLSTDGSGHTVPVPKDPDWIGDSTATSPDGSRRVTRVLNTDGTPGYHLEETDVASGAVTAVPSLVLGAAAASVAFSPDSKWLVVAVPTLVGGRLLLYGPDSLDGPYSIKASIPGEQVPIFIRGT